MVEAVHWRHSIQSEPSKWHCQRLGCPEGTEQTGCTPANMVSYLDAQGKPSGTQHIIPKTAGSMLLT